MKKYAIVYLMFILFIGDNILTADQLNETCLKNVSKNLKHIVKLYDEYSDKNCLYFKNFDTYSDIILSCNAFYDLRDIDEVFLMPRKPILLDESLMLENMFEKFEFEVNLLNVKGLALYEKKKAHDATANICCINFQHSTLDIYLNKNTKLRKQECTKEIFNNFTSFLHSSYDNLAFDNAIYPEQGICPLIFENCLAKSIHFSVLINSFLIKNRLSFVKNGNNNKFNKILPNLIILKFEMVYESLTFDLLDIELFHRIQWIQVSRDLLAIETHLLKEFKFLDSIQINILNLREFFHRGTKWLKYSFYFRNNNEEKDIRDYKMIQFIQLITDTSFVRTYEYPNEDFCLFKDFPHDQLVLPIIIASEVLTCTCTLKWLQIYYENYQPYLVVINDYEKFVNDTFNYQIRIDLLFKFCDDKFQCDIVDLENKCNISKSYAITVDDVDVYFIIKWLQYILLIILQPLLASIGIINNFLIFVTLRNKEKQKLFKDQMYKHMEINSFFNIIYCIIKNLSLINVCINKNAHSLFCSSFYTQEWSQYLKIIVQHFLGNVFRTCVNVSYLFFSLCRLIDSSKLKEGKYFKKILKLNLKLYVLLLLIFAVLISLFKLFQYQITWKKNSKDSLAEYPLEIFNEMRCFSVDYTRRCKLFDSFKIVNNSFNDILFFVFNIALDLFMLKYFNQAIDHKISLRKSNADNTDLLNKKKKINRLVILNGILFFISHMPEFIISILLLSFKEKITHFCTNQVPCDLLNEVAQFFNLISIMCTFYLLLIFDRNFKESFHSRVNQLKTKLNIK
jgi:hypothetical protein